MELIYDTLYDRAVVALVVALTRGYVSMNPTKIQYAVIAHRELTEAKRRIAALESQLIDRLATLDTKEKSEYSLRVRAMLKTF